MAGVQAEAYALRLDESGKTLTGRRLTTLGGPLYRNPSPGDLDYEIVNVGALVYGSWIAVMAAFALGMAAALGGGWWLAVLGGLSFVVSDFLIGITDIGGVDIENANDWIWLTYLAGQMGIIYAAAG